jgi:putative endonuclease
MPLGEGNAVSRRTYFVYILTSPRGALYVGITSNLARRLEEHRNGRIDSYSTRYKTGRLVHFEETGDACVAIEREKQIKSWSRRKKLDLVRSVNPRFEELSPP